MTPKRETNHWFAVVIVDQTAVVRPLDVALAERVASPSAGTEEYYSGQKCALEAVGQWMERPGNGSPADLGPRKGELHTPNAGTALRCSIGSVEVMLD